MSLHRSRFARDVHDDGRVSNLPGTRAQPPGPAAVQIPTAYLPDDHPAFRVLREMAELRAVLKARNAQLAAAHQRECDLIRILHRHVLREQE